MDLILINSVRVGQICLGVEVGRSRSAACITVCHNVSFVTSIALSPQSQRVSYPTLSCNYSKNDILFYLWFELLCLGFVFQSNFKEKDAFYIFNHVDITIHYHIVEHEQLGARLVAAKIEPKR